MLNEFKALSKEMKTVLIIFFLSWFFYAGWMIYMVADHKTKTDQNNAQIEALEFELQEARKQFAGLQEECRAKTN